MRRIIAPLISVLSIAGIAVGSAQFTFGNSPGALFRSSIRKGGGK
jgi:hypothetical protein